MLEKLQRLGQRKMAQWALAYAAAAWVALQVLGLAADSYGWSPTVMRIAFGIAVLGFIVALVLAWYHGERGQQRATGTELLLLAAVLAVGGGLIWNSERRQPAVANVATATVAEAPPLSSAPIATTAADQRSIAVLPFVNLSSDPEQEYFSDGLSEDLITALSQFNGLKVISRNSSFTFRGSKDDSATIGAKLGVAHLLAGSVRRAGDVVRISADLVSVKDGRTLWSQRFDRPYTNLFQLQDEITQAVANELKAKLLTDEGAVMQSDRPPSGSLAAYNAYLQGRYQFARNTHPSFQQAIGFYEQAIRLDPGYAAAHAALGATLSFDAAIFSSGDAARAQLDRSRRAVRTALALAPDLAVAHVARGALLMNGELDWAAAETEYRLAIRLAPNDSAGLYGLAQARAALGKRDEAIALMQQAIDRDPLDIGRYYWLSILKSTPGNLAEAERLIDIAVKLQPAAEQGVSQKVAVQVLPGQHAAALATVRAMPTGVWRGV
ncbi:MAG: tetratricopeptide repeat protein, partial [Frankiaceae bacterium]|nr:tetratricopeptide repeat protein [Arenimonas sp.]